jgi:hypothetical protein
MMLLLLLLLEQRSKCDVEDTHVRICASIFEQETKLVPSNGMQVHFFKRQYTVIMKGERERGGSENILLYLRHPSRKKCQPDLDV